MKELMFSRFGARSSVEQKSAVPLRSLCSSCVSSLHAPEPRCFSMCFSLQPQPLLTDGHPRMPRSQMLSRGWQRVSTAVAAFALRITITCIVILHLFLELQNSMSETFS